MRLRKQQEVTGKEIHQQEKLSEFQIARKADEEAQAVKQMADQVARMTRRAYERAYDNLTRSIYVA